MLRGRYRLFQATSVYNQEKGRSDKVTRYLGWLTDDGLLIPANHRDERSKGFKEIERKEKERLAEMEGSVQEMEQKKSADGVRKRETGRHEKEILRAVSMNARITVPELVKITGIKDTAVNYHLKNLEKRYDIEYALEIDIEKFGYVDYIAFAKFVDKKPKYDEIKEELEKIPYVQTVMITKGKYDMVILLIAEANSEARGTLYDFTREAFPSYNIEWTMSPAYFSGLGFVPVRENFFEVLKEKVWKRTKEKPKPAHDEITDMEYEVLKAMNNNAAADFASIDREIGADRGRSNYAYHRLTERGIIKRATINMRNLQSRFDVIFILNTINVQEWAGSREKLLLDLITENGSQADTYSFACDIMSPKGVLLMAHVLKDQDLEKITEKFNDKIKGMLIYDLIVTNIVTGSINSRLFDKLQLKQYEILVSYYKYDPEKIKEMINWEN